MRGTNRLYLNSSIRLKKNSAALNTSRRILQNSINRSVMCATSLKSNNAALAKKVAELQVELNVQRTAAREANIESCKLQMQVARMQPLLEARIRLKDSMLQMRELMATMLDTDMAVLRCVNEMASVIEGPNDGADQSVGGTTNWWADTILEMTNLLNRDRTFQDSSQVPSPILPPLRRRRAMITSPPVSAPASVSEIAHQVDEFPCVTTMPRTTNRSISPPPPPVNDFSPAIKQSPAPFQSRPSSSEFVSPSPPLIPIPSSTNSHNWTTPHPPSAQEPPTLSPVEPEFTANCSPVEPPDLKRSPHRLNTLSTDPSQSHDIPNNESGPQPNPIMVEARDSREERPKRQARLKAKPIIDLSTSHALDSPGWEADWEAQTKRRRRLVLGDDDEDYENDHSESKPVSARSKRAARSKQKTTTKNGDTHVQHTDKKSAPESHGRVVEVKFAKPGRVAFRADAKHAPSSTVRAENPLQPTGNAENMKPKSVFDLPADQTINMSVLPATLDELRKREQAKKQQSTKDGEQNPVEQTSASHFQTNEGQECANRCAENTNSPSVEGEKRLSIVLTPMRPASNNSVDRENPRHAVLTDHNHQSLSNRNFRRLVVDQDSDDDNSASENRPHTARSAKDVPLKSATTRVAAASGRSKRTHKT